MRLLLTIMVVAMVAAFDAFAVFMAWFTIGFFGTGGGAWVVAAVMLGLAGVATWAGVDACRRLQRGDHVI